MNATTKEILKTISDPHNRARQLGRGAFLPHDIGVFPLPLLLFNKRGLVRN